MKNKIRELETIVTSLYQAFIADFYERYFE